VPRSLLALLTAVAVFGIAWSLFTPPFHVPDEGGHYAYAQSLAEDRQRPVRGEVNSAEQVTAEQIARGRSIVERPSFKPTWTGAAEARFDAARRTLPARPGTQRIRSDQGDDPPLYYAYEAIPYRVVGGNFFDRLFALRIWSAALLLLTTTAAWLLAGELFGRDRLMQLVAAGCVGLQPMVTFMSAGVNPDAAAFAAAGFVLWLAVRMLRRGPTLGGLAAVVVALVAAALVKTVLLSLAPAVALAVLGGYRRANGELRPWQIAATGVALIGLGVTLNAGSVYALPDVDKLPQFVSYLWQYYLPRLPFQDSIDGLGSFKAWIWLTGSWGRFGVLEVRFPYPVYALLAVASVAAFAAALLAIRRGRVRVDPQVIAVFAVAFGSLVLSLHLGDFANLTHTGYPANQGRYVLPLLPIAGLATAAALANLPVRRRAQGAATLLGAMIALQVFSLAIVAGRFYV
jgi:hypothetical protein